jgi:hypothetical protein
VLINKVRTTSRLIALALAGAWLIASDSIGRANVVGYANVPLTNGYSFVANPFNQEQGTNFTVNNSLTNVIPNPPDGTKVYLWDVTNQVFTSPSIFSSAIPGWDINMDLSPGKGFVVYSPVNWTNSFVGAVPQGRLTNFVAGTNKLSLLGSKVPIEGAISSVLKFPEIDGANVYLFRPVNQSYTDAFTCFKGYGWFDPNGVAGTGGPALKVAEAFFVQNPGPNTNWTYNFFVQSAPPGSGSVAGTSDSGAARILSIAYQAGTVTLQIVNTGGAVFDVQFSGDRKSWVTVAPNQNGTSWSGISAGAVQGYYRLSSPTEAK